MSVYPSLKESMRKIRNKDARLSPTYSDSTSQTAVDLKDGFLPGRFQADPRNERECRSKEKPANQ